jgi:predicted DNA-binding protein YlxM (UPF0122 family)
MDSKLKIKDKEKFKGEIFDYVNLHCNSLKNLNFSKGIHHHLQLILLHGSDFFNLHARREYPSIINETNIGFLDVVWLSESKPIVAFEIDDHFYVKSIWKLLNINAEFRYWIYYGKMNEDELFMFRRTDKDKLITLINIPIYQDPSEYKIKRYKKFLKRMKSFNCKSPDCGKTFLSTYDMIQENLTINEIAEKRGLTTHTITNHVRKLLENGFEIDIDNFVAIEKQKEIINASIKLQTSKLSELKNYLGDNYSFEEIGITISKNSIIYENIEKETQLIKKTDERKNKMYAFNEIRQKFPKNI